MRAAGWIMAMLTAAAASASLSSPSSSVAGAPSGCSFPHASAFSPPGTLRRRKDRRSPHRRRRPSSLSPSSRRRRVSRNVYLRKSARVKGTGNDDNDDDDVRNVEGDGSVLGASLLFAGTAVGAGMLALPTETAGAGYAPSLLGLGLCWVFTYVTSLVALEACWIAGAAEAAAANDATNGSGEGQEGGVGFIPASERALGLPGETATALLFWFLLTAILAAYTSEGGRLLSSYLLSSPPSQLSAAASSAAFAAAFAALATYGTSYVDAVNRAFVSGLFVSFLGLVCVLAPTVNEADLLDVAHYDKIYPSVIGIGILSMGAQNVVPTIWAYLGRDVRRTRRAILAGSLMPLAAYCVWETVFLGSGIDNAIETTAAGTTAAMMIGRSGGDGSTPFVRNLIEVFSVCAVGSSMAGVSVSLVDFVQDKLLKLLPWRKEHFPDRRTTLVDEIQTSALDDGSNAAADASVVNIRWAAAVLALGPPVVLSTAFPDMFLTALEEAGLLGAVSLYGILPAISVIRLRRLTTMPAAASSSSTLEKGDRVADVETIFGKDSGAIVSAARSKDEMSFQVGDGETRATARGRAFHGTVMPGRLPGGEGGLYALAGVSAGLVLPEIGRIVGTLL